MRTAFVDPYSIRDAEIAPPRRGSAHQQGTLTYQSGWAVCMKANAKNRMGGYVGLREQVMIIQGDKVVAGTDVVGHHDIRTNCEGARYEPFTEIMADASLQAKPRR